MKIEVKRYEVSSDGLGLIGKMFIDGTYECWTMENRGLSIPAGTYPVTIDQSPLFTEKESAIAGHPVKAYSPHILNVPNRSGIRIHSGSRYSDEIGCLAVGELHPDHQDFIGNSRLEVGILVPKIEKALGMQRVLGAPESKIHGEMPSTTIWHYEQVGSPEEVTITITDIPVAQ